LRQFDDDPRNLRAANRDWSSTDDQNGYLGFRVGRTL
jgi:hypothetical protein